MKKWQIETLFFGTGWEVPNENENELYDTKAEAELQLKEHLDDMEYAVMMGFMEDSEADDWRVSAVDID